MPLDSYWQNVQSQIREADRKFIEKRREHPGIPDKARQARACKRVAELNRKRAAFQKELNDRFGNS